MSLKPQEIYAFGPYRLDAAGRVLYLADRAVPLPPKQIDTLIVLIRAGGAVVDRESLVSQVWPDTFVEEAGLTRNISMLRKALETAGEVYIETIPKRGYRFVAPVAVVSNEVETLRIVERVTSIRVEEQLEDEVEPERRRLEGMAPGRLGGRALVAVALLILVLAGAGAMWSQSVTEREASPRTVRSLAVLPFRHLNPEDADRHLSVGLADVLITRFANLSSVAVKPTSTVLRFAGHDAIATGKALGVDAVLDGTIQRSPDRMRITVQLLDVASGRPLWAGSFDEPSSGLLAVEDGVANAVASLIVPNLGREERARLARRSTANPEAWQAYLRGRTLWATRSVDDIEQSVLAFESAIRADPAFALAYAGLAQTRIVQGNYQYRWPREVYPSAKEAATRAVELDASLADAHGALAAIAWEFDWDWTTAEREFKRGLALNPNDPTLHQWHAEFLTSQARWAEALREIDLAVQLDPQGFAPNSVRATILYWSRQFEHSVAQAERAMGLAGNTGVTALYASVSYHLLQRPDEARAQLKRAQATLGDIPAVMAFTARYENVAGRRDRAVAIIRALEQRHDNAYVEPAFIAAASVDVGDTEGALKWIRQMVVDRSAFVPFIAIDPSFDRLRGDQRFIDACRSVGLADVLTRMATAQQTKSTRPGL